jgi:hypothetical protein
MFHQFNNLSLKPRDTGVYLVGVHLMGVHLTGMCLMGMYLIVVIYISYACISQGASHA